ncbi:MAG: hypothetical protein Pyrs2KO_30530 [Pyruvatibacter sp.]
MDEMLIKLLAAIIAFALVGCTEQSEPTVSAANAGISRDDLEPEELKKNTRAEFTFALASYRHSFESLANATNPIGSQRYCDILHLTGPSVARSATDNLPEVVGDVPSFLAVAVIPESGQNTCWTGDTVSRCTVETLDAEPRRYVGFMPVTSDTMTRILDGLANADTSKQTIQCRYNETRAAPGFTLKLR